MYLELVWLGGYMLTASCARVYLLITRQQLSEIVPEILAGLNAPGNS